MHGSLSAKETISLSFCGAPPSIFAQWIDEYQHSEKGQHPLKFAFSTLGCPGWTIEQAIEAAKDLGYDGIELRLLDGEVIDPAKDVGKVMRAVLLCRACGIEVCALDTSCRLNQHDP